MEATLTSPVENKGPAPLTVVPGGKPAAADTGVGSGEFGLKLSEKTIRKPEQVERIKRDIARIAKAFSNNHHIEVLPTNADTWSCALAPEGKKIVDEFLAGTRPNLSDVPFFQLRPRQVFYPISDLENRSEGEIVALLRHHV